MYRIYVHRYSYGFLNMLIGRRWAAVIKKRGLTNADEKHIQTLYSWSRRGVRYVAQYYMLDNFYGKDYFYIDNG